MKNVIVFCDNVVKYLVSFDIEFDVFEEELEEVLVDLVDGFFEC